MEHMCEHRNRYHKIVEEEERERERGFFSFAIKYMRHILDFTYRKLF